MNFQMFNVFGTLTAIANVIEIYTTKGAPSSTFDEFLAARSQFDADHGVNFSAPTSYQSATFMRPLFAFCCTLFFTRKKS